MAVETKPPFPFFRDGAGNPLDAGFLYLGTANTDPTVVANQVDVYEDAALTVAVAQPVRTLAGTPVNGAGQPVNLFVSGNYSITVKDKTNSLVYALASAAAAGGDLTIASGETMTVESGGTVDMKDGSTLNLGDDSGAGVEVVVASTTRITGALIASSELAGLGTEGNPWGSGHITDLFAYTVFSPSINGTSVKGYRDETEPSTPSDALGLNQQTNIVACGRINAIGGVSTNHFNIASATHGSGNSVVTFDEPVDDDAIVLVQVASLSANHEARWELPAGGTELNVTTYNSGTPTSIPYSFVVIGRPRGGVANPVT